MQIAVQEADAILFVVDVASGITAVDAEIGEMLRRTKKPVLLLANKGDNPDRAGLAVEFYELGLGDPMPISAFHDIGVREVQDRLIEILPPPGPEEDVDTIRIALVGRPNVGKSAIVNAILGESRVIESEMAGTTRDAIDTPIEYKGHKLVLVDTAGIRRPGKIEKGIEKYSVMRARSAIERADVVVIVLDATDRIAQQDLAIAGMAMEEHKGLIIALNKWDLMEDEEEVRERRSRHALSRFKFAPWAPLALLSAKTGLNVSGLLDLAIEVGEERSKRIPTAEVNDALREAVDAHPPPSVGARRVRIKYATQAEIRPPTFVIFTNEANLIHFSYRRYLENHFRKRFGFEGTAIKFEYRSRSE